MNRPTFSPDARRAAAAAELVKGAYCWPVVTLKVAVGAFRQGGRFFAVPSSKPGASYLANERFCACPDYQQRGSGCKHQRAVVLHLATLEAVDADARADLAFAAGSPLAGPVVRTIRPTRYDAIFPADD